MAQPMVWACKKFDALTPAELYEILRLRSEVFVVEQQCIFLDQDRKDADAHHLMGWQGDTLAAYARLLPPGLMYPEMSIGRVVSSPAFRKTGAGRQLMEEAITGCRRLFGSGPIRIGAQLYLKNFYSSLGFNISGDEYLEDGIRHVEMTRIS